MSDGWQRTMRVAYLEDLVEQLHGKLDHVHDDLVALRATAGIPRPECYETARAPRPPAPLAIANSLRGKVL